MAAPQLTRTQRKLLRKALDQHEGLILIRGVSAARVVQPLLDAGLVREVPSSEADVAWREGYALVITRAGRKAINIEDDGE